MKKLWIIILSLFCLSSCGAKKEIPQNDGHKLVYNNLITKASKNDLKKVFKSSDLDSKKVDRFFKQVDFFNTYVDKDLLVKDDYVKADKIKDYDVYSMQDDLYKNHPDFTGTNCRITTFGLISDKITVENKSNPNMSVVEIDNTSFGNALVDTENKNDINYQIKNIQKFRKDNGIKFHENKDYEVISVYEFSNIDENKNELFVGHTGLLFTLSDGRLMLVEKLAFTAPYQVVVFENSDDLYDYLMDLYDFSNDQYPIKPIIFRDDKAFLKN